jgi:hypothetical protein
LLPSSSSSLFPPAIHRLLTPSGLL